MSMDSCSKCGRLVDTDDDPDFYLMHGETGVILELCASCREELPDDEDE